MLLLFGVANRDPRRYQDPDTFNIRRDNISHITFGKGVHYCLGANLARLEGRVALDNLLDRWPDWDSIRRQRNSRRRFLFAAGRGCGWSCRDSRVQGKSRKAAARDAVGGQTPREEVHLHGRTIPTDKAVLMNFGAANRDEREFPRPDHFDINRDRTVAQNLGFGYGVHSCLGAALARMESAIASEYLLDFMPDFDVAEDGLRRVTMTSVAGYSNVPVRIRS